MWLLKKELFGLIEMRNDSLIKAQLSEKEQVSYMECLVGTAVQLSGKDIAFGVAFSKANQRALKKRLLFIASGQPFSRWGQVLVSGMVAIVLILITAVIIEPYSLKGGEDEEGTWMTPNNTYLIRSGEQYDVYFESEYWFTTDDLRPFEA